MFKILMLCLLVSLASGRATAQSASSPMATTSPAVPAASGPTPYPKDAKDWPGQGVVRVFGWMNDNRKSFWTEREKKQGSVVFAGDSLIGGWTSVGKDLPGIPVANRGIGGEPSRGLLFRFQEDVLDLHPKAIVLLSGTNDLSALQSIQQTRNNLAAMIDLAQRASPGVPIVICTVPPRNQAQAPVDPKQLLALNKLIASLADSQRNVAVLDLYPLFVEADGSPTAAYFGADKLHLNTAGYKRFHDALVPVLKQFNLG